MTASILRGLAVVIAIVALFDPSVSSERHERPLVVLAAADSVRDADLVRRTRQALGRDFEVLATPFGGADAVVAVGDRLPSAAVGARHLVAVHGARAAGGLRIDRVEAPGRVAAQSSVPVRVRVRAPDGQPVSVSVATDGAVQATAMLSASGGVVDTTLMVIPSGDADALVEVIAALGRDTVRVAQVVEVQREPWRVLFHDPRPSWGSTFVRRSIEQDGRFAVSSRILTSRGITSAAGGPPQDLADARRLSEYDAIVVGAPDALSERDVAGLESYLRQRGGSAVFLMDGESRGHIDPLLRASDWRSARLSVAASIVPDEGPALKGSSLTWPGRLPAGARTIAVADTTGGEAGRSIVWETPVGAGRVVVSGALDAWHFRDPSQSGFESFWRSTLSGLSLASPRVIAVRPVRSVLLPGDTTSIDVTLRDVVLAPRTTGGTHSAQVVAWAVAGADSMPLHFWPTTEPGVLRTTFRAPPRGAAWRVTVSDGTESASTTVVADNRFVTAGSPTAELLGAVAASRGGGAIDEGQLRELPSMLRAALDPAPRLVQWNPMRSHWWIVPFALLLGYEWWWRRRRGMA